MVIAPVQSRAGNGAPLSCDPERYLFLQKPFRPAILNGHAMIRLHRHLPGKLKAAASAAGWDRSMSKPEKYNLFRFFVGRQAS